MKSESIFYTQYAVGSAIVAFVVTGCLSMNSSSTLDNVADATKGATQPYVEGYVEYSGPQARWSGPTTFTLYVSAKDSANAKVSVTPAFFGETQNPAPKYVGRDPASATSTPLGISGDKAREQLAYLATALQGADSGFSGCLSPIRVRLVRADGALLDKQGCRGQTHWSGAVSESVNFFISGSLAKVK